MDEKNGREGRQREAERIAEEWTSTLLKPILVAPPEGLEFTVAALVSPGIELGYVTSPVDLSDVRAEVVRYGRQLRSVASVGRTTVPCLVSLPAHDPVPVDLAVAANADMPTASGDIDKWLDRARDEIVRLADLSPALSYTEVPVPQAVAALRMGTVDFVTTRIMAGWTPGTRKTKLHTIRVHTTASGLRVHYSLNISWHPLYFGAPSPIVSGKLPAGRYQFGVDGPKVAITQDPAVFDIPQITDAHLSVA